MNLFFSFLHFAPLFFPPRFFRLLLDAIKKRSAKLASIAVETRKATLRDKDNDAEGTADNAGVCFIIWVLPIWFLDLLLSLVFESKHLLNTKIKSEVFSSCWNQLDDVEVEEEREIVDDQANEGDADASDAKRKDKQQEEVWRQIKYNTQTHSRVC